MYMMFFHMTKTKHFENWMKLAKVNMVEVYLPCDVKCDLVCCYVCVCVCVQCFKVWDLDARGYHKVRRH